NATTFWRDYVNAKYAARASVCSEGRILKLWRGQSIPRKGNPAFIILSIVRQVCLRLKLVVLRLFSMFPAGVPGIALLLLRIGVAATILATGSNSGVPVPVL